MIPIPFEPGDVSDAEHPVTSVVEHEAGTFLHGGDSKFADAFSDVGQRYDIDLGVLAYGTEGMMPDRETLVPGRTKWYNEESELVTAANALELDRLLPSHYDM
jgi:L-ascorbate 6-phosphate lactonase